MTSVTIEHPKTSYKLSKTTRHNLFQVYNVFQVGSCRSSKRHLFNKTKKVKSFWIQILQKNLMLSKVIQANIMLKF